MFLFLTCATLDIHDDDDDTDDNNHHRHHHHSDMSMG
jgi:hypothetical protein